ncbi:MAG: SoxR reducing system RseC family protein [Bacteroidia bacterium]|nr:SoxR reducing system RseC family protein [Bacteroidia bacterium]
MIEHQGIIASVSGNKLSVKILQESACSACHAKGSCMAADSKEKIVDITDFSGHYKINDLVTVEGKESMGYKAVLWAFVVPILILVAMLVLTTSVWNFGEIEAAMASIIALAPYYLALYLLRDKMANSFKFTIKNNH